MLSVIFVSGANFVTRKISRSVAKIHLRQLDCFSLGNLDAKRDWGHAKDYIEVGHWPKAVLKYFPAWMIRFTHHLEKLLDLYVYLCELEPEESC